MSMPWIKVWGEKILSSINLQECNFTEHALFLELLIRVRTEEKYSGKIVYPETGLPISDETLWKQIKLRPSLYRTAKDSLLKRGIIKLDANGAIVVRKFSTLQSHLKSMESTTPAQVEHKSSTSIDVTPYESRGEPEKPMPYKDKEETKIKKKNYKPQPKTAEAALKIVFNYQTGRFENITEDHIKKWQEAYPALDINNCLKLMEVWALANPKNRKSQWQSFIIRWLTRSQDKAPAMKTQTNLSKEPMQPSMNPDIGKLNAKIRNVARNLKPEKPLTPEQKKEQFEKAKKMADKYRIPITEDDAVKEKV